MKFVGRLATHLSYKYSKIVRPLLALDEWIYLVANRRIIEDDNEREKMKRYAAASVACELNPSTGCSEFCKEFNPNKKSDIFDGEPTFFHDYYKNFKKFMNLYDGGVERMINQNFISFTEDQLKTLWNQSVLNKDFGVDLKVPLASEVKPDSF